MIQMVAIRSIHRTSNKVYYTQVYEYWLGQLQWSAITVKYVLVRVKSHLYSTTLQVTVPGKVRFTGKSVYKPNGGSGQCLY